MSFREFLDESKTNQSDESIDESTIFSVLRAISGNQMFKRDYALALEMMKKEGKIAPEVAKRFKTVDAKTLQDLYDATTNNVKGPK